MPSSVANKKSPWPEAVPFETTKSAVPLKTTPVGVPEPLPPVGGGIMTTRGEPTGNGLPFPS